MSESNPERAVLRIGCPMWAHRPWVGRFFPTGTRSGEMLPLYTSWCNAVEGNTTFYAEPSRSTIAQWLDQTHEGFRFAFKLPRTITHDKRLRDVATEVRSFLDRIEPLGDRIGPVQVQLPPTFGPDDSDALGAFLRRLPGDRRWSVELRHPGWFDDSAAHRRVDEWFRALGIGRVVLDARPVHAVVARSIAASEEQRNKPLVPVLLDHVGTDPIVRVIGEDRSEGTRAGLLRWVDQFVEWIAEGRTPYMFVHQPENLDSPALARDFHAAVALRIPSLAPLPEPVGQTSLF